MKIRILPLLSFLFALVIVSRAYALSSEALGATPDATNTQAGNTKPQDKPQDEPQSKLSDKPDTATDKESSAAKCVSGDVLVAINEKISTLKIRETEMAQKESAFKAIEDRLNKQLATINAAKASLDASVESRTALAQADIDHLTLMYQTMKPKQAAQIFNEMDVNFAAGFLRKMKGSQAGLILSNMNAKKAYQISLIIASKGAKYRKPEAEATLP